MDDLAKFISQVGFPIFVAVVLLFQVYNINQANRLIVDRLTAEIALLREELHRLIDVLKKS